MGGIPCRFPILKAAPFNATLRIDERQSCFPDLHALPFSRRAAHSLPVPPAGGLFVNKGFMSDNSGGLAEIIVVDFGALHKESGFTAVTQDGGKVQAGNSPGSASFGKFVFRPGGVNNYVFAIDAATDTAGPSPDGLSHGP